MLIKLSGSLLGLAASAYLVSNKISAKHNEESKHAENKLSLSPKVKISHNWDDNWDFRHPKHKQSKEKDKTTSSSDNKVQLPHKSRHIYLIRHGQYLIDEKPEDRWLTELGQKQATTVGQRLKQLNVKFDNVVISTMPRAKQTGELILKELPNDRVVKNESCNLLPEGAPVPPDPHISGFRPLHAYFQQGARIEAAFRKYFHRADPEQKEHEHVLLVCHANVIRYFVCRALQIPEEAWLRFSLKHGSITHLEIRPSGRVIARTIGDAGFMPPEMTTTS